MIIGIDPGPINSAYVIADNNLKPLKIGIVDNFEMLNVIKNSNVESGVIEMIASYGMSVGKEVFETCVWIGRFIERALQYKITISKITRLEVKMHICHDSRAKDANITQSLIDSYAYGVPNRGKGTVKEQGWFYGFKEDIWSAYAVLATYVETENKKGVKYGQKYHKKGNI